MGLERTVYQVSESVGVVEVCAVVRNPTIVCPIAFPFTISFSTADGTAGNKYHGCKAWYACSTIYHHPANEDSLRTYHHSALSLTLQHYTMVLLKSIS